MTDRVSKPAPRGIAVADITVIALVAVMIVLGKTITRIPISVSGHGGVLWIAALVIGRAIVRRPWAGTLMGVVGGLLVVMFQPSEAGPLFGALKYIVPGMVLDGLYPLLGRFDQAVPAMLAGAAAHLSKVVVDFVQSFLLAGANSNAAKIALVTLATETLGHLLFGILGGLLAAFVLKALIRAKIPQLRGRPEEGGAT